MESTSLLENSIDKILMKTEKSLISDLENSKLDAKQTLENSLSNLEKEYEQIISDGKKEADKIKKQIIGSSDLEIRNKQLTTVEQSIERVFSNAIQEITNSERGEDYSNLIKSLLDESIKIIGTNEVIVLTNSKDKGLVQQLLSQYPGVELSSEMIDGIGGVKVRSKDGTMSFDNTIDAKIERLKPLIRKEIATKFGVGN